MDKQPQSAPPSGPQRSWKVWWIWCLAVGISYALVVLQDKQQHPELVAMSVLTGPFVATFYYGGYYLFRRWTYRLVVRQLQAQDLSKKTEVLQDELEKDFFTNLVRINFKYLDKYYLQTQEQGDKSFLLCCAAAVVGLLIIVAGISLMFFEKVTPAYLTTAAGVISEFIAGVFFYMYNKTILSMATYHQKLVLTQNIALALKITGELPEKERVPSQQALIDALTADVNRLLVGAPLQQSDKP